jgi:GT2 family glycosyltransferase
LKGRPISIVIPTWNGREILARNLPSVEAALARYPGGGETIVVDDGSRDGSAEWLASTHPSIRVLATDSNKGFGESVNRGVDSARFSHVVLLNNDICVEPDFLAPLMTPFDLSEDLFATTPCIINRTWGGDEAVTACTFRFGLIETVFPDRSREGPVMEGADRPPREVLFACGGAMAFDRGLWLELGGFDPLYAPFYWEDVDLSWRARKRGWRIVHIPSSRVRHEHGETIGTRFDRKSVRAIYERNRLLFHWKNITSARLTAVHLAWLPLRVARAMAGRPDFLKGLAMAMRHLGRVLRARRLGRTREQRSDDEILRGFRAPGRGR